MKLGTLVKWSFVISFIITSIGAYLKITHADGSDNALMSGILATLIFIVSPIYEVSTSTRIDHREKTMWTIGFIFMGGFTGLIYFLLGRKRIASEN